MRDKIRVGIVGASGYGGLELIRILLQHPLVTLNSLYSSTKEGESIDTLHPSLKGLVPLTVQTLEQVGKGIDLLFISAPHGRSMQVARESISNNPALKVVDLGADFRLPRELFEETYHVRHEATDLLDKSVYGSPELFRGDITSASIVASPGCFAHAIALAAYPLAATEGVSPSLFVSGVTGSTGSGATPQQKTHHPERNESLFAYSPLSHRHVPEIEYALKRAGHSLRVRFVPHSGPFSRGIYATLFAHYTGDPQAIHDAYAKFSERNRFVRLRGSPPRLQDVRGSNFVDLSVTTDEGTAVVMVAIDNLVKGAAGNGVQCMNLMLGVPEETGLLMAPFAP